MKRNLLILAVLFGLLSFNQPLGAQVTRIGVEVPEMPGDKSLPDETALNEQIAEYARISQQYRAECFDEVAGPLHFVFAPPRNEYPANTTDLGYLGDQPIRYGEKFPIAGEWTVVRVRDRDRVLVYRPIKVEESDVEQSAANEGPPVKYDTEPLFISAPGSLKWSVQGASVKVPAGVYHWDFHEDTTVAGFGYVIPRINLIELSTEQMFTFLGKPRMWTIEGNQVEAYWLKYDGQLKARLLFSPGQLEKNAVEKSVHLQDMSAADRRYVRSKIRESQQK